MRAPSRSVRTTVRHPVLERVPGLARGAALALALAAPLAACQDDTILRRLPEPEIQIDELKQRSAALVDILWVVDNSESMVDEQALLAQNFDRFITGLTICQGSNDPEDVCDFERKTCTKSGNPCNPPNYHIGVISTDVVSRADQGRLRRVGICVPNLGSAPVDGKYKYCRDNAGCAQDPQNPDPAFDARNATCDIGQSISFIDPNTRNAANAFARAVRVGVGGSGLERGIQAAAMALGRDTDRGTGQFRPAPTENNGFLRPEASLFVIFVSDEDDSSFGQISYFYRAFEGLKEAGNEGLVSISAIVGDPDPDGSAGPLEGGCRPAADAARAQSGTRYIGLAMYSRGLSAEFRVCDGKRLNCPEGAQCAAPISGFPTAGGELGICIPGGACQTDQDCGNFNCAEGGCIVCENARCVAKSEKFVELLSDNGVFGSICNPDYGEVLGALGFEAAGLRRKFQLTKYPNCAEQVPCGDATAPVCVKVAGEVVANDRSTGWVWDPSANAIFFDGSFVPPTDAPIEVSYRIARAGLVEAMEAQGCETALK